MDLKPTALYGEVWIAAQSIRTPTDKPATWVDLGISGAWEFSDNIDDTVISDMRIPYRMNRKVKPTFTIGWGTDGISSGNAKWQLEYLWREIDEDMTAPAQEILTIITPASVIASNGMVLSTMNLQKPSENDVCIHVRIKRLGVDADDTIVGTVELKGICMRFNLLGEVK